MITAENFKIRGQKHSCKSPKHVMSDNAYCNVNFVRNRQLYKPYFKRYLRTDMSWNFWSDLALKYIRLAVSPKINWQRGTVKFYKCGNFIVKHLL